MSLRIDYLYGTKIMSNREVAMKLDTTNYDNGFKCCTCGKFHAFTAYVLAHMRFELIHYCDHCGAKHSLIMGSAKQMRKGRIPVQPGSRL